MIEDVNKRINEVKEAVDILPKKTKANIQKLNEYLDLEETKAKEMLELVTKEIDRRRTTIKDAYSSGEKLENEEVDLDLIRSLNPDTSSYEKMNLGYYFYVLTHYYNNDLNKINEVCMELVKKFSSVGINLLPKDFIYSKDAEKYMDILLNGGNTLEVFDEIYWNNSNIIKELELNFRYLYWKNKKLIDKFYSISSNKDKYDTYIKEYLTRKEVNNNKLHNSKNYLYNLFINKEYQIVDFTEKNIDGVLNELLLNRDAEENYSNLRKLYDELLNYKKYLEYSYIIDDLKELYKNKTSYKGIMNTTLKKITKKEAELFKLVKKYPKAKDTKPLDIKKTSIINELDTLYDELDSNNISDTIFNKFTDNIDYLTMIKYASNDFNYMTKLLKTIDEEIDAENIRKTINELYKYIYGNSINTISNVHILEEKNLDYMLRDRFRLTNIKFNDEALEKDSIDDLIGKVKKIIIYYDLLNNKIDTEDIEFILKSDKLLS